MFWFKQEIIVLPSKPSIKAAQECPGGAAALMLWGGPSPGSTPLQSELWRWGGVCEKGGGPGPATVTTASVDLENRHVLLYQSYPLHRPTFFRVLPVLLFWGSLFATALWSLSLRSVQAMGGWKILIKNSSYK